MYSIYCVNSIGGSSPPSFYHHSCSFELEFHIVPMVICADLCSINWGKMTFRQTGLSCVFRRCLDFALTGQVTITTDFLFSLLSLFLVSVFLPIIPSLLSSTFSTSACSNFFPCSSCYCSSLHDVKAQRLSIYASRPSMLLLFSRYLYGLNVFRFCFPRLTQFLYSARVALFFVRINIFNERDSRHVLIYDSPVTITRRHLNVTMGMPRVVQTTLCDMIVFYTEICLTQLPRHTKSTGKVRTIKGRS